MKATTWSIQPRKQEGHTWSVVRGRVGRGEREARAPRRERETEGDVAGCGPGGEGPMVVLAAEVAAAFGGALVRLRLLMFSTLLSETAGSIISLH
jgi:predicted NUDIX family NTP pyrophosphohydrolase